jgi:hypothetical protein
MIAVSKIDVVISLATARERAYNLNPKTPSNTLDLPLETYLNNLSFDEVKSLQAIMYLGRDKDYDSGLSPQKIYDSQFEYFDKTLGWNKKDLEVNQMIEKMPLADYLLEGKRILAL